MRVVLMMGEHMRTDTGRTVRQEPLQTGFGSAKASKRPLTIPQTTGPVSLVRFTRGRGGLVPHPP